MSLKERGIYRRGNKFYIHFHVGGKRFREKGGMTSQAAREKLAKRRIEEKANLLPAASRENTIYIGELLDDFLAYSQMHKRESSYVRDSILVGHLRSFFADRRPREVTPALIDRYRRSRMRTVVPQHVLTGPKTVNPATTNREVAALKAAFNLAVRNGKVQRNPVIGIKFLRENKDTARFLNEDEIRRLVDACPARLKPFVLVALATGMRRQELLDLQWRHIDFAGGVICVQRTKTGRPRKIPISQFIRDVLTGCRSWSDGTFIFCNSCRKRYTKNGIYKVFRHAVKRAGIGHCRIHDLRHSCASHLVMSGVDLLSVMQILGHQSITMTQRYSHLSPSHIRSAAEVVGDKIRQATATNGATKPEELPDKISETLLEYCVNSMYNLTDDNRVVA